MSDRIEKSEPVKEPPFGSAGGLYYPSDGAYKLAEFLGLDEAGRAGLVGREAGIVHQPRQERN